MKTFLISLLLAFSSFTAHADIEGQPFIPEIDARFNAIEQGQHYNISPGAIQQGAGDGHSAKQVVQATYDFAKYTGALGTYDLGYGLPKNAEIVRSYIYSITQPATSASGTLEFYCQTSANGGNIKAPLAAGSYGAAGVAIEGLQTGTAANFSTVTAPCHIQAVIGTGALTAGKVTVFLEYVTHQ